MKKYVAFGWTLTGMDDKEPNASTNAERIEAMKKLHNAGFRCWASIEPIIDIESSMRMIEQTYKFCDHYKIGLESGKKYDRYKLQEFVFYSCVTDRHIYFKDSLLSAAGISREDLPNNCVNRDYNMFTTKN
jgi:hypothetical protein